MKDTVSTYAGETALMRAVAQGRHEAFEVVLEGYMPMVARISYRILCDRTDSEYVTNEVFMRIWNNASAFDGDRTSVV